MLHPYLASTDDPFLRLVRAYYWFVNDPDFRNNDYWREQIAICEVGFLQQSIGPESMPSEVRARRQKLVLEQAGVAMREAYIARLYHRGGVSIPEHVHAAH